VSFNRKLLNTLFSPDGAKLALVEAGDHIDILEINSLTPWSRISHPGSLLVTAAFSQNGRLIATADQSGRIRIWDLFTSAPAYRMELRVDGNITTLGFGLDDQFLIIGLDTGASVIRWTVEGAEPLRLLFDNRAPIITSIASRGGLVLLGDLDGHLFLVDLSQYGRVTNFQTEGPGRRIVDVAFSPNGTMFMSIDEDNVIRGWHSSSLLQFFEKKAGSGEKGAFRLSDREVFVAFGGAHEVRLSKELLVREAGPIVPDSTVRGSQVQKIDERSSRYELKMWEAKSGTRVPSRLAGHEACSVLAAN
jgi:WD40 repeat protein